MTASRNTSRDLATVTTMRAAMTVGHGDTSMIELRDDVRRPVPLAHEVLVRVAAASINNTDLWSREGAYGTPEDPGAVAGWKGVPLRFPRIQGADVCGVVDAVGADVDASWAGRRVLVDPARPVTGRAAEIAEVMGSEFDGGFAEYVAVDAAYVHDVTDSPLTDAELACLPIAYGTAMGMLDRAEVVAGECVVVTGASGGVGSALVQLAAARGARVIGVTSAGGRDAVLASGAAATVDRGEADLANAVLEAAGGEVDVVADVVGGDVARGLLSALTGGGRWVIAGAVAGAVIELDLRQLYLRSRRLIGSTMHTPEQFERLVDVARRGDVSPRIQATRTLSEIRDAQREFRESSGSGKIVLIPGQ
ncbi:zinc-binding dehydrogenase [Agrococcus sp. ProA11]|uniref:zinc-binding dehydrogenase n=1 Tax=Agrococcus chionoecetis TaxID=3153752 RepID=UPI003260A868